MEAEEKNDFISEETQERTQAMRELEEALSTLHVIDEAVKSDEFTL